jgi:ethanolamine utilization cobalamin adenosyltransferase
MNTTQPMTVDQSKILPISEETDIKRLRQLATDYKEASAYFFQEQAEAKSELAKERERVKELEKDKERLDWYDYYGKNPSKFTVQDCIDLFKAKERLGIRAAIDSAIAKQKGEKV